ncbi:hypothetical protein D3C77_450900 [compost metagenome]
MNENIDVYFNETLITDQRLRSVIMRIQERDEIGQLGSFFPAPASIEYISKDAKGSWHVRPSTIKPDQTETNVSDITTIKYYWSQEGSSGATEIKDEQLICALLNIPRLSIFSHDDKFTQLKSIGFLFHFSEYLAVHFNVKVFA